MSVDEIVKLYEAQKHDKLTAKLKAVPLNSLVKLVKDALNSDEHDKCTNFLRALFQGWENAPDLSEVIVTVYKLCLKVLQQASAEDSFLIDLISILNHEAVRLATADLVELCSILLNMIHNAEVGEGKWLKLFTKLLEVVDLHTGVRYDKSEDPVTGAQYKHHVICEICSCTWPTDSVVHLANAFKDIKLEAEDADIVVTKLLDQLGSLESQLLPPYVYQLLGLATKCGQVETALRGILKHFMTLDEKFSDS
uniref:FANCI solenoid 1 domain-containing protein n=1 Tax=Ciona savignyi TaxID=51511 RepID=H2ZJ94_CIOSA